MRDHAARLLSRSRPVLCALLPWFLPWSVLAAQAGPALPALHGVRVGFDGAPAVPAWAWVLAVLVIAAVDARRYLDLHRAVGRRQHMERQLQELGDNLPAVVYQAHIGRSGRLQLALVAGDARQLFDLSADTLRQHPQRLLSAVLPEGRRRLLAALARAKRSGHPLSVDFQARGVHGVRMVSMRAWPVPGVSAPCWSGYWMDDSLAQAQREHHDDGRRRAEHEARARDRLLHVLGEGIRAPLRELDGAVAALGAGPLPAAQRSALDALQQATVMLQQIMTEVLEEPVADVDTLPIRAQPTDLPVLLQQVLRLMQPLAQSKGLQLQLQMRDAPGRAEVVCVDALRLRQVLLNLIGNAIRFTRQGGVVIRVRVVGEATQQRVRIQVVDSGIGIAPLQQQRVFEPYQQAGAATAAEFGGTGLGLGICRKLVLRMQGELHLRSRPGRGTRVTLELPLSTPPPTPAWNHIPDAQVLVADDHPAHRLLLQWRLQILGLRVLAVADGTQALQAWRGGRFQLLVCDEQMPGLRGSRLAARIRHEERQRGRERVAIIGMSAEPSMARSTHIDHMLGKAATTEELRQIIAGLCPQLLAAGGTTAASVDAGGSAADLQAVLHRLGSPQLSQQLLQTLCDSLQEDILKLRRQRRSGHVDARAQALTLHRIAGAMGSIGLGSMARWLHELSTRQQPLPADEHRQVVERLQACLRQWRQLPPPA